MSTITPAVTFPVSGTNGQITGSNYNTTPSYSGTFIPPVWSAKLNAKFYAASVYASIMNSTWEGEISGLGDKVIINNVPDITISDYTVGQNLVYQTPVPSTVELTIDKGKAFAFAVSDVLSYQAQPDLMDAFSNDASEQMKVAIDADCMKATVVDFVSMASGAANRGATAGAKSGAYNLGTDSSPITLTNANVLQKILELASVLDEQNVPETERWLVINPYVRTLLMQSNLAQAQFMGDSTSIVRNGMVGKIDRFTVYVSNQLPKALANQNYDGSANAGAVARSAIIAGHRSAACFASQMVKTESLRNPNDFGDLVRGLQVYGRKVVKAEAMALLQIA
jgi:hypothetical protein